MGGLVQYTQPATEPVSLVEAKAHLRVTSADTDSYISSLITAARVHCEQFTRRAFVSQAWELSLDGFPEQIDLSVCPVVSVGSIVYYNVNNVQISLSPTLYSVDIKSEPARVVPVYGQTWPQTYSRMNSVRVIFDAGYGGANAVPQPIKQAILLLVGAWFESRQAVADGNAFQVLPLGVESLLTPYRLMRF